MPVTKEITHDVQVLADGQLQVREITHLMEGSTEIARTYNRYVIDVGQSVEGEPELIRSIADAVHTPTRVAARQVAMAKANGNV